MTPKALARRQFIQFLAASPLVIGHKPSLLLASSSPASVSAGSPASLAESLYALITSPDAALDVFDFERVAGPFGSSCTLPPTGPWRRNWSSGQRKPGHRSSC